MLEVQMQASSCNCGRLFAPGDVIVSNIVKWMPRFRTTLFSQQDRDRLMESSIKRYIRIEGSGVALANLVSGAAV